MTSHIFLKANSNDMNKAFNEDALFSVRAYQKTGYNLYEMTVRHKELRRELEGVFTLAQLKATLSI